MLHWIPTVTLGSRGQNSAVSLHISLHWHLLQTAGPERAAWTNGQNSPEVRLLLFIVCIPKPRYAVFAADTLQENNLPQITYIVAFQLSWEGDESPTLLTRSICNIYKASHFHGISTLVNSVSDVCQAPRTPRSVEAPVNTSLQGHLPLKATTITTVISRQRDASHTSLTAVSLDKATLTVFTTGCFCLGLQVQALRVDFLPPRISHTVDTHSSVGLPDISTDSSAAISQPLVNAGQETTVI